MECYKTILFWINIKNNSEIYLIEFDGVNFHTS